MRGHSKRRGDAWITLSVLIIATWVLGAVFLIVSNWPR
jgi:hypothetical protein